MNNSTVPSRTPCRAKTKHGRACRAPAVKDGDYCSLHASPGRAAELGRTGGRNNRVLPPDSPAEVVVPTGPADMLAMLASAIAQTVAGLMHPYKLMVLAQAARIFCELHRDTSLEQRLQVLENSKDEIVALSLAPPQIIREQMPSKEEIMRYIEETFGKRESSSDVAPARKKP